MLFTILAVLIALIVVLISHKDIAYSIYLIVLVVYSLFEFLLQLFLSTRIMSEKDGFVLVTTNFWFLRKEEIRFHCQDGIVCQALWVRKLNSRTICSLVFKNKSGVMLFKSRHIIKYNDVERASFVFKEFGINYTGRYENGA